MFDTIWSTYHQRVVYMALRRTHNLADAEDIAAETFVRAWRHRTKLTQLAARGGDPLWRWLCFVAGNLIIDRWRYQLPTVPLPAAFDRVDPYAFFEQAVADDLAYPELHAQLAFEITKLDGNQRRVVQDMLAGLSYAEISAKMGISIGAVKSLRIRAIAKLKLTIRNGNELRYNS